MLGPVKHLCESGYGFDLHGRAGAAAVEGVVVGIDRHGQRVGGAGDGVRAASASGRRRGMGVGVVVVQAARLPDGGSQRLIRPAGARVCGKVGKSFVQGAAGHSGGRSFRKSFGWHS